jgi:hypothetical protein
MCAKRNPAAGNCGARNAVCLAANSPENSRIERPPQARFARLRRQRLVAHLHRLGPAPLGHFLNEVSIIADRVLALRQPPRERKAPKEREAPYRGGAAAFDDSIPFGGQP